MVAFSAKLQREVANVLGVAHRVLDVSMLLLYLVLLYGCFGVILFRHTREGDAFFPSFGSSYLTMFVLLTTGNHPLVMLPAYENTRLAFLFFASFLCLGVFFLMNLILATIVSAFKSQVRDNGLRMLERRRAAIGDAFDLLVDLRGRGSERERGPSGRGGGGSGSGNGSGSFSGSADAAESNGADRDWDRDRDRCRALVAHVEALVPFISELTDGPEVAISGGGGSGGGGSSSSSRDRTSAAAVGRTLACRALLRDQSGDSDTLDERAFRRFCTALQLLFKSPRGSVGARPSAAAAAAAAAASTASPTPALT